MRTNRNEMGLNSMNRKFKILNVSAAFFICLIFSISYLYGQEKSASLEDRFQVLENSITSLKSRSIDIEDLEERFIKVKQAYEVHRDNYSNVAIPNNLTRRKAFLKEMNLSHRVISLSLDNLETVASIKVGTVNRLEILYLLMVVLGLVVIIGVTVYTIWMYARRK